MEKLLINFKTFINGWAIKKSIFDTEGCHLFFGMSSDILRFAIAFFKVFFIIVVIIMVITFHYPQATRWSHIYNHRHYRNLSSSAIYKKAVAKID